jgi:CheY-like chemotaxis protein
LLVEDEACVRRDVRRILEGAGHRASEASSVAAARQALDCRDVDLVVLDLELPDGSGLGLLSHLSVARPTAVVVGYLVKSADPLAIEAQVEAALSQVRAQRDVRAVLGTSRCYKRAWPEQRIVSYFRECAGKLCPPADLRLVVHAHGIHAAGHGGGTEALKRTARNPRADAHAFVSSNWLATHSGRNG